MQGQEMDCNHRGKKYDATGWRKASNALNIYEKGPKTLREMLQDRLERFFLH